jgi:hypothetical protein
VGEYLSILINNDMDKYIIVLAALVLCVVNALPQKAYQCELPNVIGGVVCLDLDGDGNCGNLDYKLPRATVTHLTSPCNATMRSSEEDGSYLFNCLSSDSSYSVEVVPPFGYCPESVVKHNIPADGACNVDFAFHICPPTSGGGGGGVGYSQGYWKRQATICNHTFMDPLITSVQELLYAEPFTLPDGCESVTTILSSTAKDPISTLKIQLLAVELNIARGWVCSEILIEDGIIRDAEEMCITPSIYTRLEILNMKSLLERFIKFAE